ncbi:hypothetical protein OG417_44955 [Actinoallomurus sp. NBC_01490]|nr:hypothetical protein [Actinoallomurus sp. NBC_01490]
MGEQAPWLVQAEVSERVANLEDFCGKTPPAQPNRHTISSSTKSMC